MTYLDDDTLLFTVPDRHCIESVDLSVMSQPIMYAGQCGTRGSTYNGHRIYDTRMFHPTGILSLGEHLIYFTTIDRMYMINDFTDQVSLLSTGLPGARMLTYDPYLNALLVGVNHGIMRVDISDGSTVWLSGSAQSGTELNDFNNAGFVSPIGTVVVSETAIITSDFNNR